MTEGTGRLIVDGHLDLAVGALQLRRDLTRPVAEVRRTDPGEITKAFGTCTVTLPELRRGGVAVVFATLMARLDASGSFAGTGLPTQEQCFGLGRGHAGYYEALERRGEVVIIRTRADLDRVLGLWQARPAGDPAEPAPGEAEPAEPNPLGLVVTMESSDPIMDPDQVRQWHDWGLRMASLSHYGKGAYSHGTGTEGGLLPGAADVLGAFERAGVIADLTHLTDRAFWEVLDAFGGPVAASHHNCRALVPGQRQLDDAMIRAIAERGGVIGASLHLGMLDPRWQNGKPGERKRELTMEAVADHIDHVCQVTGGARHAALGSDLDGGFGIEQSPRGLETVADLRQMEGILEARGYTDEQITDVLSGNWLRLLRGVLAP